VTETGSPTTGLQCDDAAPRQKVIFVAGAARSGTTLVGLLLGQIPGCTAVGELRYLWQRGLIEGRLCGCGRPVPQCGFWRDVLRDAGMADPITSLRITEALEMLESPRFIADQLRGHMHRDRASAAWADRLAVVYRAVAQHSGAAVVVDSSKPPTYGSLLRMAASIDLYVVHVVRDPRACAFSLQRSKAAADRPGGGLMRRQPSWKAALTWDLWNLAADRLRPADPEKYLRVRYEDLVRDPERWLGRIAQMVRTEGALPRTRPGQRIDLGISHTVAGNPMRLTPTIEVQADAEWSHSMQTGQRRLVQAISSPVMHRYGYATRLQEHMA
jgi:hypothetical protein